MTTIPEIIAISGWRQRAWFYYAQSGWINTAYGKDHSQKNLSKLILWYRNT